MEEEKKKKKKEEKEVEEEEEKKRWSKGPPMYCQSPDGFGNAK